MKKFIEDYLVDECGNLYSTKRGNDPIALKPFISKRGYLIFRVCVDGKVKAFSAHHLSYYVNVEQFDTSDGLEIDHIDGNKLNNHFSNLRRVTSVENSNNPITKRKLMGNHNGYTVDIDSNELIDLFNQGYSFTALAKHFNCSRGTIKNRLVKIGGMAKR